MAAIEQVILVDEFDHPQGVAEKLEAHKQGWCHRAFSIFLYRNTHTIELLMQQRAKEKYHSPNLWTNTCCSHPRPQESTLDAAERRLFEELGVKIPLHIIGKFHYIAHFDNGLTENEVDHVIVGELKNELIKPNPNEVQNTRWVNITDLQLEFAAQPKLFTPWLGRVLDIVSKHAVEVLQS